MRNVVLSVLLRDELEHLTASRVVKVDINIGHRDAVGVEEAFKQEVIFKRIDVGDAERISDGGTGGRATSRTHPHTHLTRVVDVVVDDQEVARKAHRLDDVELEVDALHYVHRNGIPPAAFCAGIDERLEVVRLELDAEHLIIAAETLEILGLVLGVELLAQLRLVVGLRVFLFAAELRRNREFRHDRVGVEFVLLNHIRNRLGRRNKLRMLGKELKHLLLGLEILLTSVDHALRI